MATRRTYLLLAALGLGVLVQQAKAEQVQQATVVPALQFQRSQPRRVAPFPLELNAAVRRYVDAYLAHSEGLKLCYERSQPYLSQMTALLERRGVPSDLLYLAFAESAFSKTGAGPWQLTKRTARRFGLRINHYLDERRDPIKSTRAAAEYLAELHDQVGDWRLTIVAWNTGESELDRLVPDGSNYSRLLGGIPPRTRALLNRFMAVAFIARNAKAYGIEETSFDRLQDDYKVIHARGSDTLSRMAAQFHTSVHTLRRLNPALLTNRMPPGGYDLLVPAVTSMASY
jgi:membrane-bound lytic murein transglycosylase D